MDIRERLNALPKSAILQMFCTLRGADTCGFNHDLVKKAECVERLLSTFGVERVAALLGEEGVDDVPAPAPTEARAFGGEPISAVDEGAIAQQIAKLFATLAGGAVNEQRVREIVKGEVGAALERTPVVKIEVQRLDGTKHTVPGHTRPEFQDVLTAAGCGLNVLLVGPAGCGKTHLAHQVAEALGRGFASISCTAGMSESALMGWMLPGPGGEFVYVPSDFVTMYEQGGVFLFDEIDAADANTLLFVNQALANGSFYLPMRKGATRVVRHPQFVCIAAANTFGTGSNMVYAGRERLDESTLDRFRAGTILLDYDKGLERAAVDPEVLAWGWAVRARIAEARLQRVMSTRFLLDATKLVKAGRTLEQIRETYFTGWKQDERAKVEV